MSEKQTLMTPIEKISENTQLGTAPSKLEHISCVNAQMRKELDALIREINSKALA